MRNSLRMRPDRIIVGEVRGAEALDMLQAMNTGHDGSLTTVHANTPRDALSRIETMVSDERHPVPDEGAARADGIRRRTSSFRWRATRTASAGSSSLQEINGMEGEIITMSELFTFRRSGLDAARQRAGAARGDRHHPGFVRRLAERGAELPVSVFTPPSR